MVPIVLTVRGNDRKVYMNEVIQSLLDCGNGDHVRLETESSETYTVFIVSDPEYIEPDGYAEGYFDVSVELDTDVHDVPTEEFPSETGNVHVSQNYGEDELEIPKFDVWKPITSNDDPTLIIGDKWLDKGRVADVAIRED